MTKPKSTALPLAALTLTALLGGIFVGAQYQQKFRPENTQQTQAITGALTTPSASAIRTDTPEAESIQTQAEELWPELDRLLAELKAEEQATGQINSPATGGSATPNPAESPPTAGSAAVPAALPSLEPLIDASSATWLTSSLEQRLLNSLAMLKQIFKDQPERIQIENVQTLENCISAAAGESDLGELQVKDLAAACALALNWR